MDKNKTCFSGCIYKYTNLQNGKVYIGQTSNLKNRRNYHEKQHHNKYPIDKALSKYGIEHFEFEILVEFTCISYEAYRKVADQLEMFYIKQYRQNGYKLYNITNGGGYSWADYNKNRVYKKLSKQQKSKISNSLREYYKTHNGISQRGGKNPRAKRVFGIKDGIVVCEYSCGKDLCKLLQMNYSTFRVKMRNNDLIVNNILYLYETDFKKGR